MNEICKERRFLTNPREDGHFREHERKPGEWGWKSGEGAFSWEGEATKCRKLYDNKTLQSVRWV